MAYFGFKVEQRVILRGTYLVHGYKFHIRDVAVQKIEICHLVRVTLPIHPNFWQELSADVSSNQQGRTPRRRNARTGGAGRKVVKEAMLEGYALQSKHPNSWETWISFSKLLTKISERCILGERCSLKSSSYANQTKW